MIKTEILIPLLNANEPEARLAGIHVKDGQAVEKGILLFTIETTKAASDIESPESGFVRFLAKEGDTYVVGERLAVITDTAGEPFERKQGAPASIPEPSALRITNPARTLADSLGLDLMLLPTDRLVTEEVVRRYAAAGKEIVLPPAEKPYLLIYGAGGHAKSLMEMVKLANIHTIAGVVDDNPQLAGKQVLGIPVVGTRSVLATLYAQGVRLAANGVGGILDINVRVKVFGLLAGAGYEFPAVVSPHAVAEPSSNIGEGVQVFANAYVGADAVLEPRCMVNTAAVVSHDCVIGEYTHIAPGAMLAGHVHVGKRTLVGMGVTTAIGINIGSGVRVGNGAIVLADVPDKTIIQAGKTWVGKIETP